MEKALKMMETELDLIDVAVYVLDSRAPFSCVNPSFENILQKKPIIYVLNKADLVDSKSLKKWQEYFSGENKTCIVLNSTESNSSKKLIDATKELTIKKLVKNEKRGVNIPLRMMIIGVPNCGKSTLINNLCGKGKTITGDRAGVTRGKQWVTVASNLEVLDTPGTLWPNLNKPKIAHNLAYIGSIKEEVLDVSSLALDFLIDMILLDHKIIEERYNICIEIEQIEHIISQLKNSNISNEQPDKNEEYCNGENIYKCKQNNDSEQINMTEKIDIYQDDELKMFALSVYEQICKKRGFLLKNKEYDYERCARAILDDFKKGRLGKIILD